MTNLPGYQQYNIEEYLSELDDLHARIRDWAKSMPKSEYRALATYLYWMKPELSVPQIAEMIGFTPSGKVNEIVDKRYPFPIQCEVCGESKYVHYNSRKRRKMYDSERELLLLVSGANWQERRSAYIKGTYYREFPRDNTSFEMDYYTRWRLSVPSEGVCDECRARLQKEFDDIERLRQEEVRRCKEMRYQDYLRTDHWLRFRDHVLWAADSRCQLCNRGGRLSGVVLNVHHRTYENLGNESLRDVVVLCQTCHHNFHETGRLAK